MHGVRFIVLCTFVFCSTVVWSQDQFPRIEQYELDVDFHPAAAFMEGRATVYFPDQRNSGGVAVCYLHGELNVDSIMSGGKPVEFTQDKVFYQYNYALVGTEIKIDRTPIPQSKNQGLTIFYSGYFHPSQASSPSDYMRIDQDGVLLRAYGYSLWFPIFLPALQNDYPVDFSRVIIRTPIDFHAVFVGDKINEWVAGDRRISEWSAKNVGLFQAQCTAQRFAITREGEYNLYHYHDSLSRAAAESILEFARTLNREYNAHYRKGAEGGQYHIMEMPRFGDISSGNVTGITADTWQAFDTDLRRKRYLAHELVHPFVHVHVDRRDPLYCLAIEGFPSYLHLPVLAGLLGDEWYNEYMAGVEQRYLERKQTGKNRRGNPLPIEKPLVQIAADELPAYKDEFVLNDRALLFLDNLYRKNGPGKFFSFTADIFNRPTLTAMAFRDALREHFSMTDQDLDLWLNSTEYPDRLRLSN
jgi:hypothetical protein